MPMKRVSYTQTDTGAWAADNAGIRTAIEKTGYITRMDVTVEVTPSATLGGANQPDGLFRVIENLRIEGGSHTYVNLPADDACMGGTLLHYLNLVDGFGLGHGDSVITAPSRTYTPVNFVIHAGSRPRDVFGRDNPFDISAMIPAVKETGLNLVWVTAGNDVMDDTVTISSATMRITLHMLQGSEQELAEEMKRQGVARAMKPAWVAEVFGHTATKADYTESRNLETGGFLKRIAVACQDATATRSARAQDEATGFMLELPNSQYMFKTYADWMLGHLPPGSVLEADDAALDFGIHNPKGIFIMDCRSYNGGEPDYGIDMQGKSTGDAKLKFTVTTYASGDDSLILQERYLPV